jgi:hypothetical protein
MGQTWWLNVSYDETTDEFFAYVDDGVKNGVTVYYIDDTKELCEYIQTGVMKHLDDVDGLTEFLVKQQFIGINDVIKLNPEILW